LLVRVWCNKEDFWGIQFDLQEKVKLRFDQEGISIPYPQTVIHSPSPIEITELPQGDPLQGENKSA